MKNIYKIVLLFFCFFNFILANSLLYVGTDATAFPPFEYIENGEITGFDIDLMKEIGKTMDKTVIFKNITFAGLFPALDLNKIDVIIAGMTITEERKKYVDFSDPYYFSKQLIIVNKFNNNIKKLSDIKDYKIGVVLGTTGDIYSTKIIGEKYVYRYDTTYEAILSLKSAKIDAVMLDSEPAKNFVLNNQELKIVDKDMPNEDFAIVINKKNPSLLKEINKGLKIIKENGTYEKLYKKYFN